MISGASGGAVPAAYFGSEGKGYVDLRERFLLQDAEKELHLSKLSPANLVRVYEGGANDRSTFAAWLDQNVFDGATYGALRRPDAPIVWINASDIYNGTPFDFTYDTFAALCSDLDKVRLADAVAASAAFPVVFKPLVVSTAATATKCNYRQPEWLTRALADPAASVRLKAYARSLETYQNDPGVDYIKLLDGGLTDNIGVTGILDGARRRENALRSAFRRGGRQAAQLRLHRRRLQRRDGGRLGEDPQRTEDPQHRRRRLQRRHPLLGTRRVRRAQRSPSSSGAAS